MRRKIVGLLLLVVVAVTGVVPVSAIPAAPAWDYFYRQVFDGFYWDEGASAVLTIAAGAYCGWAGVASSAALSPLGGAIVGGACAGYAWA